MNITEVKIRRISTAGKMKAVASVTFDDSLAVHDIKVIEANEKLFIAMPSRKVADGEYRDIVHPINTAVRQELQDAIIKEYKKSVEI